MPVKAMITQHQNVKGHPQLSKGGGTWVVKRISQSITDHRSQKRVVKKGVSAFKVVLEQQQQRLRDPVRGC